MKRYLLVTYGQEEGKQAQIGKINPKSNGNELTPDVIFFIINEKSLENLDSFSQSHSQTFKAVVEGAVTLLQCVQQVEDDKMMRYILVILDDEKGAEVCIGKAETENWIPDVTLSVIDDKVLKKGLPVFSESENQIFKTVVEGAIELIQCA